MDDGQTDRCTNEETYRPMCGQTDKQMDKLSDLQTYVWTHSQTKEQINIYYYTTTVVRQTDKQTDRQTDR